MMNRSKIEDLYDNMQDKIVRDICKDSRLDNIWAEINKIDELLKNTLSKEDYDIFDDYLSKGLKLIDLERKKAFAYGYNLSNKLMIESMRE